jgi:hypothetical protein
LIYNNSGSVISDFAAYILDSHERAYKDEYKDCFDNRNNIEWVARQGESFTKAFEAYLGLEARLKELGRTGNA